MSKLVLSERRARRFGAFEAVERLLARTADGRVRLAAGAVGLRQDHDLAHDRGLHAADRRHDRDGRPDDLHRRRASCRRRSGGMSMIFQSYAIWPNMTVGENVGFGLQVRKLPRAEIERRVDAHPRRRADARPEGPLSGRAVGRPAAARGAGARHRGRARGAAARRAARPTSTPTCARRCASRSAACTTSSRSRRSTSPTTSPRRW